MPIQIDNVLQLGIGWEVSFRPADEGEALAGILSGHGLRVVSVRQEHQPGGEVGQLECERPGGELSRQQLIDLLDNNDRIDLSTLPGSMADGRADVHEQ